MQLCRFLCLAFLLNQLASGSLTVTSDKSSSVSKQVNNSSDARDKSSTRKIASVGSSARQYFLSNRDSYVNAANSVGSSHGGVHHQHGMIMSSYQIPQGSYDAPINQGYHTGQQQGGYGWSNDNSESSSSDLVGLIGLLGLKGLKGTIPVIKKAVLIFIALLPILLPLIIPLALIKLPLLLLTPVITFGRGSSFGSSVADTFQTKAERISEKLEVIEKFNETATDDSMRMNQSQDQNTTKMNNDVIGRDADNQCMERIACEGLFSSLPRILRMIGQNQYVFRKRRRRDSNSELKDDEESYVSGKPRRKDLATMAVNKLKNSHYLTKKKPLTENAVNTKEVCKQYKCSVLF